MTQANPYSPLPGGDVFVTDQRTSVLAIVALVLSIVGVCLVGVTAPIGAVLGIVALVLIANSGGRLRGRGIAISAIVVGLLVVAIWAALAATIFKGMSMFTNKFVQPAVTTVQDIDAGNFTNARAAFTPEATARLTDADFERFRTSYQAELGAYKGAPQGFFNFWAAYGQVGPLMQQFQGGTQDVFPMPGEFEKGMGVVAVQMKAGSAPTGGNLMPPMVNLMIVGPSGKKWTLWDPAAGSTAPPSPASDGAPAPGSPASGRIELTPGSSTRIDGWSVAYETDAEGKHWIRLGDSQERLRIDEGAPLDQNGYSMRIENGKLIVEKK
ncbi:MAG TPA: DUF4190 domain-containing protein [Phycisphaerales bacterium]|nr:DUF4190 domain-containing protein [Phycisphaerales bacterium]